jgi:hypothetical protein
LDSKFIETIEEENKQLRRLIHELTAEKGRLMEENKRLKQIIRIFAGEEE